MTRRPSRGRRSRPPGRALTDLAGPDGAPASTYVSAVVSQRLVTVCWLGDSRAYWLAANAPAPAGPNDTIDITGGSRRVTRDDSLAEEIVAAGLATMDEAMASPQAHVITRWLGADLPEPRRTSSSSPPPRRGVLLLCSDGLWNYRPEAAELAAMAMPAALTRPLRRRRRPGEVRARLRRPRQHHGRHHPVPAAARRRPRLPRAVNSALSRPPRRRTGTPSRSAPGRAVPSRTGAADSPRARRVPGAGNPLPFRMTAPRQPARGRG